MADHGSPRKPSRKDSASPASGDSNLRLQPPPPFAITDDILSAVRAHKSLSRREKKRVKRRVEPSEQQPGQQPKKQLRFSVEPGPIPPGTYRSAVKPQHVPDSHSPNVRFNSSSSQQPVESNASQHSSLFIPRGICVPVSPAPVQVASPARVVNPPTGFPKLIDQDIAWLEQDHAAIPCMRRLRELCSRLGVRRPTDFTNYARTTIRAILDIKALIAGDDVPHEFRFIFDNKYRKLFNNIRWRFKDVFEAIDFLSAFGRDELFGTTGITCVVLTEDLTKQDDRSCCFQSCREMETFGERCYDGTCLACAGVRFRLVADWPRCTSLDKDWDRPPCEHRQTIRLWSLLAARQELQDPSTRETAAQARADIKLRWKDVQQRAGWDFEQGPYHWPNKHQERPLNMIVGGTMMSFRLILEKDAEGKPVRLQFSIFADWAALI